MDMDDPDCGGPAPCTNPVYATNEGANGGVCCDNGIDEDNDSFVDMNDTDCISETCDDGIDNDGDLLVDCNDPDCCKDTVACPAYATNEGANGGLCCNNDRDDDNDGQMDDADSDCLIESCDDGIDNNGNGLVDCEDPYCCGDSACPTGPGGDESENDGICCANGADDDQDGLADKNDPDCNENPIVNPKPCCRDGKDNDGDGLIDCEEVTCCNDDFCKDMRAIITVKYPIDEAEAEAWTTFDLPSGYDPQYGQVYTVADDGAGEAAYRGVCCADLTDVVSGDPVDADRDGFPGFTDPDCDMTIYAGSLESDAASGEIHIFDVVFTDSSITPETEVDWAFSLSDSSPDCIGAELNVPATVPVTAGGTETVGTILLHTGIGDSCIVEVQATADGTTAYGTYVLNSGPLPQINPGVQLPEIPAILHPINIYPRSREEAENEFSRAYEAADRLSSECAGCAGLPRDKLQGAWTNLAAAQRYLDSCPAAAGELSCSLSQYYSARALTLANEGLSIL